MSIRPLDLQTLFVKMANVGKDQAAIQKSVENQQAREAIEIVKEENRRDKAVNKTEEDKEVDKVKDQKREAERGYQEEKKKEEGQKEKESRNYFTDPKRGHNLDISG